MLATLPGAAANLHEHRDAMITAVEIKNFKSIKSLSFDLPKFAVLVGPNGSGKTNVVQALELFGEILQRGTTDPVNDRGWEQILRRGKRPARGGVTLGVDTRISTIFPSGKSTPTSKNTAGVPKLANITLSARIILAGIDGGRDVAVDREEIIARRAGEELRIVSDKTGWKVALGADPALWNAFQFMLDDAITSQAGIAKRGREVEHMFASHFSAADNAERGILRLFNRARFSWNWLSSLLGSCRTSRIRLDTSALRDDSSTRETRPSLLGPAGEGLPAAVARLKGSAKDGSAGFKRVLGALQRVYPRIEDIRPYRIQPGRLTLFFKERGIDQELGQSNVSDGVLHALALLVMLEAGKERERSGLLAIEEPENAIHPWSLQFMLERAQSSPQQVLVTTHSETVVDCVKDPSSLLIVENDDHKGTIVTPARDRETALDTILAESGQKLGDVWLDGSLGGVPGR